MKFRIMTGSALVGAGLLLGACQTTREAVVAESPCQDVSAEIYFETDSARLGEEARALIGQAVEQAQGCRVTVVEVLGLAGAPGASAANLELSKARAEAVQAALAAARLPAAQFHIRATGETGAVTGEGLAEPMRRRVEILLRLAPPEAD